MERADMKPVIHREDDFSVWAIWVETDYNEDYVSELKQLVKPRHRRWDADRRVWLFKDVAVDLVCALLERHFGGYTWAEPSHGQMRTMAIEQAYSTLHLLPSAPADLVKHVYRWHCKRAHPDAGGDLRQMQEVNIAYAMIEKT